MVISAQQSLATGSGVFIALGVIANIGFSAFYAREYPTMKRNDSLK